MIREPADSEEKKGDPDNLDIVPTESDNLDVTGTPTEHSLTEEMDDSQASEDLVQIEVSQMLDEEDGDSEDDEGELMHYQLEDGESWVKNLYFRVSYYRRHVIVHQAHFCHR